VVETAPIQVATTEATRADWARLPGLPPDPSFGPACGDCPVESITFAEARAYCAARSIAEGLEPCDVCAIEDGRLECHENRGPCLGWRLPTGEEWEVAARGGMPTNTPLGDVTVCMRHDPLVAEQGWTKTTSGGAVRPVALKPPNVFGLHDLVGNVAEWTADPPDASGLRALRGGSWYHNAEHVRASAELRAPPDQRLAWAGVRCVRSLP